MRTTVIDWQKWITATDLAALLTAAGKPTTPQTINNWKRRGKVDFKHFPELGKDLIRRGTINVKGYEGFW